MRYRTLFAIVGPLVLWAAFFTLFYSVQAVGCRAGWDATLLGGVSFLRLATIVLLVISVIAAGALYIYARSSPENAGVASIARYSALAGFLSTILVFPGVIWLQLC